MPHIRTRFAPSPTGLLHVGGVRTALFAWLLARQNDGEFILRIEDTDKNREVEGAEQHIQDSLKWLGIEWDESTDIGGPHAPYRQSERLAIYIEWAKKLVESGRAYADPYTPEEVEGFRLKAKLEKRPFLYRDHRPEHPPVWDGQTSLRFRSEPKAYTWNDAVMGELHTEADAIDDFVLVKADGYPTYNFCHIIDDMLMEITHVFRSQEFISSVPKFLNLYEALNIKPPVMATLPYVMALEGKKKLSKRDGAKDILDYGREGYLPEAMMNFLATLGWNDGSEQEIFTPAELKEKFSLDRVQKSPARFDEQRLLWLNGQWIRRIELDDLYSRAETFWPVTAGGADKALKKRVLSLIQDRLKTLADIAQLSSYFFEEPTVDWSLIETNKQLKKLSREEVTDLLASARQALESSEWDAESIQQTLNTLLETTGQKPGILFSLIRIATTWAPFSPQLNDTLELLGKETVLARLENASTGS
jgi:glutamyl-tRNA synthetase